MKKILVTGGAGYIGSHTVVELENSGYLPIIVDNFSNSERSAIEGIGRITGKLPKVYEADCTDEDALRNVFEKEEIMGVIHFAAYKSVGESVQHPHKYYANNINSTITLLKVMLERQVNNLVFSSSCTVYGQPEEIPVTEDSPVLRANSPYGHTKQICEQIIQQFQSSFPALKTAVLRYFNPIGAHPSAHIGELPLGRPDNLVPFLTQTAAGWRDQLTIFGNDYNTADGTCVRDYIHVVDLARAHVMALDNMLNAESFSKVINLGMGQGYSVKEVVEAFERVTRQSVNHVYGPRRPGDVEQIYSSCKLAREVLGWECEFNLEDMLSHAWAWQQQLTKRK